MSVQIILPAFLLKGKKKKGSIPLVKGTCVAFLQLCFCFVLFSDSAFLLFCHMAFYFLHVYWWKMNESDVTVHRHTKITETQQSQY